MSPVVKTATIKKWKDFLIAVVAWLPLETWFKTSRTAANTHNDQMVTSFSRLGEVTIESTSHKIGLAWILNHKNGKVTNVMITNPDV